LGKTDELELSGGINRFSRETISSIPAGVMMSKRCIFCKNNSTGSKALEHIVPESLGNEEHTLPPGIVCDPCNNYFASGIEQPVLESGYFLTSRFNALIPNKRRRMPSLSGILLPGYRNERQIRFHRAEVSRDARGDYQIFAEAKAEDGIASGEISRVIIPASGPKPDRQLFSRFLAKVAVECMAQRLLQNAPHLLSEFVDDEQVDLARNYARFGRSGLEWPYSERQIYSFDFLFPSAGGESYEVLHEWTFLYTDKGEMYFVLAILGVEYVINVGGPDVEGYGLWLRENDDRSPLYPDGLSLS
jgi:hypothetical protein